MSESSESSALKAVLGRLLIGERLDRADARAAMRLIMDGQASATQIAGFLVALRMRGETVDEITGFAEAMRAAATHVNLPADNLVDTCGTGGDGAETFNISTTAALVAAGAGAKIAKHGNRSVSSRCGSADVLEELGVVLTDDPTVLQRCLQSAGFAFMFAPLQHPAMKHAVGPRRELGVRTVFNLLGPLTNPALAPRQLLGVYDGSWIEPVASVLGQLGSERAMVVHGAGDLDEISTLGPTEVAEWDGERVRSWRIEPRELGLEIAAPDALAGGDAAQNADIIRRLLDGEPGAPRDIVVLNAAAALCVAGVVGSLADGLEASRASVDEGDAAATLEALVAATGGAHNTPRLR